MAKIDYFNMKLRSSELPTSWLWFYVKIRFPLGIVLLVSSMIAFFSETDFRNYYALEIAAFMFFFSFDVINFVLTVWTYAEMKNLSIKGFKLNKVLLWYGTFYIPFGSALEFVGSDASSFWSRFLPGMLFIGLIWMWPNLVYFNKRKFLFSSAKLDRDNPENDINHIRNTREVLTEESEDLIAKIEKLSNLKDKGIITEAEFEHKKKELLEKL